MSIASMVLICRRVDHGKAEGRARVVGHVDLGRQRLAHPLLLCLGDRDHLRVHNVLQLASLMHKQVSTKYTKAMT